MQRFLDLLFEDIGLRKKKRIVESDLGVTIQQNFDSY